MKCLFEIHNGKAKITNNTRVIRFYKDIIDKWGESIATKIFVILHFMADLSLENPFSNISELEKLEKIIHSTYPDLPIQIDWNSYEMQEAIEFTRKLYETNSYRHYLANKTLLDKLTNAIYYANIDGSKESGNAGEVKKINDLFSSTRETTKKIYEEFLDEQGTIEVRGKGKKSSGDNGMPSGKSEELE